MSQGVLMVVSGARFCPSIAAAAAMLIVAVASACTPPKPSMTVTPADGLQTGAVVQVTARGLRPSGAYELVECAGASCNMTTVPVTADGTGRLTQSFKVDNQLFPGPPRIIVCRSSPLSSPGVCQLVLRDRSATPPTAVASVPLTFRAEPPRVYFASLPVEDGTVGEVLGGELPVGPTYQARWCRTVCDDQVVSFTVNADGHFRGVGIAARYHVRGARPDGTVIDETCWDRCQVRITLDGETVVATTVVFTTTTLSVSGPLSRSADTDMVVSGAGLLPGGTYLLDLCGGECRRLATPVPDAAGSFTVPLTVPPTTTAQACPPSSQCELKATPAEPGSSVSRFVVVPVS